METSTFSVGDFFILSLLVLVVGFVVVEAFLGNIKGEGDE
jgi:hypothetical protein